MCSLWKHWSKQIIPTFLLFFSNFSHELFVLQFNVRRVKTPLRFQTFNESSMEDARRCWIASIKIASVIPVYHYLLSKYARNFLEATTNRSNAIVRQQGGLQFYDAFKTSVWLYFTGVSFWMAQNLWNTLAQRSFISYSRQFSSLNNYAPRRIVNEGLLNFTFNKPHIGNRNTVIIRSCIFIRLYLKV